MPRVDGRWGRRAELVSELLARAPDGLLFFAGCSEEQAALPFDYRVLLTAPRSVLMTRLRTRTTNGYGRHDINRWPIRRRRSPAGVDQRG